MKKAGTKIAQRVVAVVMSAVMALSLLVASPQEAQAGLSLKSLGCNWTAIAKSAVKGALLWGIGKAEAATSNDTLASVLSMTERIVGGYVRYVSKQTLEEVKHISAQLTALYNYTITSTHQIEDMIADLASNDYKNEFNNNASKPVDSFTLQYTYIVTDFNNLLDAFVAYGEDSSDVNRETLKLCYEQIINDYFNEEDVSKQIYNLFTTPLMGDSDTTGFLALISPYNPKQGIASADDMTNPDIWESRSVDTHYLHYYYDYITTVTNFQSNVYDSMCAAASIVDNAAYMYLQAYRYYCELEALLLASDASLSENEQRSQTTMLWKGFYDAAYRVVRGINQMYYTYEPVFATYMRSYDVAVPKRINNYQSSIQYLTLLQGYEKDNGYSGLDDAGGFVGSEQEVIDMKIIQEYQNVYQFRLVSDPSLTYAIRSSSNSTSEEVGASRAFYSAELQVPEPANEYSDCTHVNPEVYMLLRGLEGGYQVPVHMSELETISAWEYYHHSGLLSENVKSELEFGLGEGNVHLPEVVSVSPSMETDDIIAGPNFLILRSDFYVDMEGIGYKDSTGVLGNVSMTYDVAHEAELDFEDDIADHSDYLSDKETVTMWTGTPQYNLSVSSGEGGEAYVVVGDDDQKIANGQSATLVSGTAMTVRVFPAAGYTIDSVSLLDGDSQEVDNIFGDMTTDDGETISTQEQLEYIAPEADGGYSFAVPMAYRDVTVQATFKHIDQSLASHNVVLNDVGTTGAYDAVCQFGSYDYLSTKSFKPGEQVIVSVVGYNHLVSKALTITDAAGQAVDVAYEDVSDAMMYTRPTERLYAFNMPEQDILVTPVLGPTNSVTVVTDNAPHVTHKFEDLNLISFSGDTDWAHAKTIDFEAGDTVSISYTANVGYVASDVKIVDANYNLIPASVQEGKIVFTMPNLAVAVNITESEVDLSKRMLTLDPELEDASFQFVEGESLMALTQREYNAGETVQVKSSFSPNYTFEGMLLTAIDSDENLFDQQGGTYDSETGLVTFTMPDANATLSAMQTKKPLITLDTAIEGARLQFVDDDGNAEEATARYVVAGETVKVSIQLTDDTQSVESILLTTDDGDDENLFEGQSGTYDPETGMVTFAMPDVNATLSAKICPKTQAIIDGFDTDDGGKVVLIHTYEDLVKFAKAVEDNPEYYSHQDVALTNNIDARGKEWEQPIGYMGHEASFFDEATPYYGTFEGNGYCIFGLRFSHLGPAYLIEELGEGGVVRNLYVFDCDSEAQTLGDIGALVDNNYGLIEDCVVGTNEGGGIYVDPATGDLVSASQNTSAISAGVNADAGGVVAVNHGTIRACRSAVEMKTRWAGGGIAGRNYGTISGCVSTASIDLEDSGDCLGGIAGDQGESSLVGCIEGGYSAAEVVDHGGAHGAGTIVGGNTGTVVGTYYAISEDHQQPFGAEEDDDRAEEDDDWDGVGVHNVQGLDREYMTSDSFLDSLGSAEGNDGVAWVRGDGLNGGLPRILNESAAFGEVSLEDDGVRASGNMHTGARLAASRIPGDSEAGRLLSAADDGASGVAYACAIEDADGNRIPAELWVQSDVTYTVPVSKNDVSIAVMLADGSVVEPSDVSVKEADSGYEVTFTSEYAAALMVLGDEPGPEPEPEPTPDDGLDRDDDGRILIGTYEDLVKFSQLIRLTPADYTSADLVLTKNIDATGKEAWTQGIGSQVDNIFYNGTFEGNGYCIFGLDISAAGNAGLFEVIGEKGVIRNLFLYDCDCQTSAQSAGGIAAYNYGTIEYCVNGVNLTNGVFVSSSGQVVSLNEFNSVVDANVGGGIVGNNYGTIYACRSAAVVRASSAGSIAGQNNGTVNNCAGNSAVSSTATDSCNCGGLVGSNGKDGVVEGGYSSATISSSVPYRGSITGVQLGSIVDTYYTTSEDQQPFESSSESTETNVNGLARGEMMADSFLQKLGAVGSNSVTWIRHDALNAGLPRIKNESAAFADATLVGEGLTVKGNLHVGASVEMTALASDSEAWVALAKDTDGYTAVAAYSCALLDDDGNTIPDELWAQSELTYTIPVSVADVAVKVLCRDGNMKSVDDVKVEKADTGYAATFTADGVGAIMVLQGGSGSDGNAPTTSGTTKAGTTTVASKTANTGDRSQPMVLVVLLAGVAVLLVAGGMMWRRRNGAY